MKKAIVAGLIAVAAVGQAYAWGPREQGALAGIAGTLFYQQITRPQVVGQPPVTVGFPGGVIQTMPGYGQPQVEYRTPPVYSQQYPAPNWGVSCIPAYDQFGRYLGCVR
jgi:hypothetical protein